MKMSWFVTCCLLPLSDPLPLIGNAANSTLLLLSISGGVVLLLISTTVFIISHRYSHTQPLVNIHSVS